MLRCCSTKPIIWVLGGPASGKTTQCELMVGQYGFAHLSLAELLQEEIQTGSDEGSSIAAIMKSGEPLPTDIMLCLLSDAMQATRHCCPGFLIDGFPRNKGQAQAFEKKIEAPSLVLNLEAADDVLVARLLNRAACFSNTEIRVDVLKKHLKPIRSNNKAIFSKYKNCLVTIQTDGRSVYDIYCQVQEAIEDLK